ncbi:rhomboid family intramembrane serine protease [Rubinisphaera margarita]|uniref:rhomboid family intramembrane serine protease n=1 Tax=Rubinisphaera margarita TaxID=2909586 RepID=UPI001EE8F1CB|nr:rhomboid family intramembrane serine protease [Rubinisphaera margarita]MCG6156927.1 rhomboid family intramembrane serine protease [Rubinisphaera margarita]
MFFLIPIGTDAPIYHWPYGTVALIVINTLLFFLVPDPSIFAMHYGGGVNPIEWVTASYMHGDIFHLVGNMIFLWGFGIIVEGKIGWLQFLTVYNVIGFLQNSLLQLLMPLLGLSEPGDASLGASNAIYGLLAMALVWAPKNELTVFLFIFLIRIIARVFDCYILTFGVIYIGFQFTLAWLWGFRLGSEMLHLAGAWVGLVIGLLYLKLKWVDCEGWDLISYIRNEHGKSRWEQPVSMLPTVDYQLKEQRPKKKKKKSRKKAPLEELEPIDGQGVVSRKSKRIERIRQLLAEDKPSAAATEYESAQRRYGEFTLAAPDLLKLANGLARQNQMVQAIPYFEQFVQRFPDISEDVRLKLAFIYITEQERPRAGLRMLSGIEPDALSPEKQKKRIALERQANQLIEEGVLEFERPNG